MNVDTAHGGGVAVNDLGKLLEGRAARLDVHGVDEDELDEDPALRGRELVSINTRYFVSP